MWEWERTLRTTPGDELSARARSTLMALRSFADEDGANMYPSYEALANMMGVARSRAIEGARELEDRGWLVRTRTATTEGRQRTVFEPRIPVPVAVQPDGPKTRPQVSGPDPKDLPTGRPKTCPRVATTQDHSEDLEEDAQARVIVQALADLVQTVNPSQAARTRTAPEVVKAATACVVAGITAEDVRAGWYENVPNLIDHGPRFAVALLDRLAARPLQGNVASFSRAKRERQGRPSNAPRTVEDFGEESSQSLIDW